MAHAQCLKAQFKGYEDLESAKKPAMVSDENPILEIAEESPLTGTGSVNFTITNNGEKGANGTETKPYMNEAPSVDEQQTEKKELNKSITDRSVRRNKRAKKSTIPLELTKSLRGIPNVKGFDVVGKEITIHVLQGHEEEAKDDIEKALNEHPPVLNYHIETFRKTDCIKLHSESVGGYSISRCFPDSEPVKGTIGCLLKLNKTERSDIEKNYDGKIYAVTCHHVAKPEVNENSILFETTTNDGQTKEFSREIEWYMLDSENAVDIALIPVEESCDAFNFQHDDCIKYQDDISKLVGKTVQKQGAISKLTRGEIVAVNSNVSITDTDGVERWYNNAIKVKSTEDNLGPFSVCGDSGSLVTLSRNTGDKTHQAVSMVIAGGEMGGKQVSITSDLFEATYILFQKYDIDNEYTCNILSNFHH